jgi:hypothetical protein
MDGKLPWYQRLGIRFHLAYCVWCRRYLAQLQFLRRAAKGLEVDAAGACDPKLSNEAKEQMLKRLEAALKDSSSSPR